MSLPWTCRKPFFAGSVFPKNEAKQGRDAKKTGQNARFWTTLNAGEFREDVKRETRKEEK